VTLIDDSSFPDALTAVAGVHFEFGEEDGDNSYELVGVDYTPYREFQSAEDLDFWFRLWTGNSEADGGALLRVFGVDGSGGFVAFWLARPGNGLVEQPVVYLGSEGDTAVIARDLADYLWLLADGFGPAEAVNFPDREPTPNQELRHIAETHAPGREQRASAILAAATQEFPEFGKVIEALCR
jgi:hypothetical protein